MACTIQSLENLVTCLQQGATGTAPNQSIDFGTKLFPAAGTLSSIVQPGAESLTITQNPSQDLIQPQTSSVLVVGTAVLFTGGSGQFVYDVTITCTYDDEVAVGLTANPATSDWTFAGNFAPLPDYTRYLAGPTAGPMLSTLPSFFNQLSFASPEFSAATSPDPALSFSGVLDAAGPLQSLPSFLSISQNLDVSGPISLQNPAFPLIALSAALPDYSIPAISSAAAFSLQLGTSGPNDATIAEAWSYCNLGCWVSIGSFPQIQITAPLLQGDFAWALSAQLAGPDRYALSITNGLSVLSEFAGGSKLTLPDGLNLIGSAALTEVHTWIVPASNTLPAVALIGFTVETDPTVSWTAPILGITIKDLFATWEILDPFSGPYLEATLGGTLILPVAGKPALKVKVDLSGFTTNFASSLKLSAELDPNTPVHLGALFQQLSGIPLDLDLTLAGLTLKADTGSRTLQFVADLEGKWPFPIPFVTFGDTQFIFNYAPNGITGSIACRVSLLASEHFDGFTFLAQASYPEPNGGWQFSAWLLPESQGRTLQTFVKHLFSTSWVLPAGLGNIALQDFSIDFNTKTKDLFVSGALTWPFSLLGMDFTLDASMELERTEGAYSGHVGASLMVGSLTVAVYYYWNVNNNNHVTFEIGWQQALLTCVLEKNAEGQSTLTVNLSGVTLGGIIEFLVNLVDEGLDFQLPQPWNLLNLISLDNLTLEINLDTREVGITYTFDDELFLPFMDIESVTLNYMQVQGDWSVVISLQGDFNGQEDVTWDLIDESPPGVGAQDGVFDLRFFGIGQNITFANATTYTSVDAVVQAMEQAFDVPEDPLAPPLQDLPLLKYSGTGNWLIGFDFVLLDAIEIAGVFADPDLYGIQITAFGAAVGPLAGLDFEIFYEKVTDTIGVYEIQLCLPEKFRQIQLGAVTLTLPMIGVDIYTNGNFTIDFGFPYGGDFTDSCAVTVEGFGGLGGFYFSELDGSTATSLPAVTNGTFGAVVEFGIGLSIGLDATFDQGPLEAGASLLLEGIVQGTFAVFHPNDSSQPPAHFYYVTGTASLVGNVFGVVDLMILKLTVNITAAASITFVIEAYEPIQVEASVSVEVEAALQLFFITIPLSFHTTLQLSFTLGSASPAPWIAAQGGSPSLDAASLRGQRRLPSQFGRYRRRRRRALETIREHRRIAGATTTFDWTPRAVFDSVQTIPLMIMPALTVASPDQVTAVIDHPLRTGDAGGPAVQAVMTLYAQNAVGPGAHTADEVRESVIAGGATAPFVVLAQGMLQWAVSSVDLGPPLDPPPGEVSIAELDALNCFLADSANRNAVFTYSTLASLMEQNFVLLLSSPVGPSGTFHLPGSNAAAGPTGTQATIFPMIPALQMAPQGMSPVSFASTACATAGYASMLETYYDQLRVQSPGGASGATSQCGPMGFTAPPYTQPPGCGPGTESLSSLIFADYFALVTRQVVQNAIELMNQYPYEATGTESLASLAAEYGSAPALFHTTRRTDTIATLAHELRVSIPALRAANPWLRDARAKRRLPAGATVSYSAGPSVETIATANQNYPLQHGRAIPLTGVQYQVQSGDTLGQIASIFGATASQLLGPSANSTNSALPATGASMVLPPFQYTVTANDLSMGADAEQMIAARFYVRFQPPPPSGELSWYIGAIGALNATGPTGVLAPVTVPQAGASGGTIEQTGTMTYYPIAGDTIPRIAAICDLVQLDPDNSGFQSFLGGMNPNQGLAAGTVVTFNPPAPFAVGPGQSFLDVAKLFYAESIGPTAALPQIASANAAATGLLTPLSVMVMPQITYIGVTGDTLATVATKLNLTLDDLANGVQDVTGIFAPYDTTETRMTIPDVAAIGIDDLVDGMVQFGSFNTLAAATSRYLLHGMRVPQPGGAPQSLFGMYDVAGQQFPLPADITNDFDVTFTTATNAPWIAFDAPPGSRGPGATATSLTVPIGATFVNQWSPSPVLDPQITGPFALPLYNEVPLRYVLDPNIPWQPATTIAIPGGAGTLTGQPALWMFPDPLVGIAQAAGPSGTAPYELVALTVDNGAPAAQPLTTYCWAMAVPVDVTRAPSAGTTPMPNSYVLSGADQDANATLLAAWSYLQTNGSPGDALYLLYAPSAAGDNPNGLASDALASNATFVLKTNLSTVTQSTGNSSAAVLPFTSENFYAGIDSPAPFLKLVWEAAITNSGGFYLQYTNADGGAGLPSELFASSTSATLWLVLITAAQSAPTPDLQLYPFNNCAVVGQNADAAALSIAAQLVSSTAGDMTRVASVAPGNVGFVMQRINPSRGPRTPESLTQNLYSLLGYGVEGNDYFTQSNQSLPAGPRNAGAATGPTAVWTYQQVVPVAQFGIVVDCPGSAALPPPGLSPYRGLTGPSGGSSVPLSSASLAFDFYDVYGNSTELANPIQPLAVPFGYTDPIIGVGTWPGAGFSYQFLAPTGATAPVLDATLSLQATKYIANPGLPYSQAVTQAAADASRYTQIFYQVHQSDFGYALESSIGTPLADGGDLEAAMNAFVVKAKLFADATAALQQQTYTTQSGDTLNSIAGLLGVTPGALGAANANVAAASLFASQYIDPLVIGAPFGNTLTSLAAGQVDSGAYPPACPANTGASASPLTVATLASNNSNAPLTPGIILQTQTQTYTVPSGLPAAGNTLSAIASTLECTVANLIAANLDTPGLIANGLSITIHGVTVKTSGNETFSRLSSAFKPALTPAQFASAIANVPGIFNPQVTLDYDDFVVPDVPGTPGSTPAFTLDDVPPAAGGIAQLATLNADVTNFYDQSAPVYISFTCATPQAGATLASLSQNADLPLPVFATYNGPAPLAPGITLAVPNLTYFPSTASLYAGYEAQPTDSLQSIATAFAGGDVGAIAALNQYLPGIFAGNATITIGSTGYTPQPDDSLQSVSAQFSLGFAQFIDAIAGTTSIFRPNGVVVVPLPAIPAGSIAQVAAALNIDGGAAALLTANQSLQGFVANGGTWSSGGSVSVTAGPYDTIDTILARIQFAGGPALTIAQLAAANASAANLLAAGNPMLLPPNATEVRCDFHPALPPSGSGESVIMPVTVTMTMTRAQALVSPDFQSSPPVFSSINALSPSLGDGSTTLGLTNFAANFEAAFQSIPLKCATTNQGSDATRLWAVNFGLSGIDSVQLQAYAPQFFALPPLSTSLVSCNLPVPVYSSGHGLCAPAPRSFQNVDVDAWMQQFLSTVDLVLTPPYAIPAFQYGTMAGPAGATFAGPTSVTGPSGCPPTTLYGPSAFNAIVSAKKTIAAQLQSRVAPILETGPSSGYYATAAADALGQQMLQTLSSGYAVSAVVQFPVGVSAPFLTPPGLTGTVYAPCFSGKFVPVVDTLSSSTSNSIAGVASFYQVSPAWLAQILGNAQGLVQPGVNVLGYTSATGDTINSIAIKTGLTGVTGPAAPSYWAPWSAFIDEIDELPLFQPNASFQLSKGTRGVASGDTLETIASFFNIDVASVARANDSVTGLIPADTPLSLWTYPGLSYTTTAAETFEQALAGLNAVFGATHVPSATLDDLAFSVASQQSLLAPGMTMSIVETLPQFSISTSKLSLGPVAGPGGPPPAVSFLLTVKNVADVEKILLNLDYVITQMEFGIANVPGAPNYRESSWLTFVIPIGSGNGAAIGVETSVPQVQVPLPLRSYPSPVSMIAQSGTPQSPGAATIAGARAWQYSFDYISNPAAQDTEHVIIMLSNVAPPPDSGGAATPVPDVFVPLATFSEAYPALKNDLALLTTPNGAFSMTAAYAVQTVAALAGEVGDALSQPSLPRARLAAGSAAELYGYRVQTFNDGIAMRTLQLAVEIGPTGESAVWPSISVQLPGPSGATTTAGAFYELTSNDDGFYEFPSSPLVPIDVPLTYSYAIANCDAIAQPDGWSGVYIDRNAALVASGPLGLTGATGPVGTNPAFLYQTPLARFIDPVTPLIDDPTPIDIGTTGQPLSTQLETMLTAVMGLPNGQLSTDSVQILSSYAFPLASGRNGKIAATTPIRLLPTTTGPQTMNSGLAQSLSQWMTGNGIAGGDGYLVFDVTVFNESAAPPRPPTSPTMRGVPLRTAAGATATPALLPMLRLRNLRLPLSAIQS